MPVFPGAFTYLTDTKVDNLGRIDNAPYRAAFGLLFFTPFAVAVFGFLYLVTTAVLHRLHRYSFRTRVIVSVILAVCIGAYCAAKSLSEFGPIDAGITFGMFAVSSFICLLLDSIAWWYTSP